MGLESGDFIEDLDPNWPLGTDFKSQGDDHIRLIKKILQDQFPNLGAEAVERTAAQINAFPTIAGYLDTGSHESFTGDLDDINKNSKYVLASTGIINAPSDYNMPDRGFLMTMLTSADFSCQVLYGRSGDNNWKIWMRSEVSQTWSDWKLVVDGGAFTDRLAGYSEDGKHDDEWVGSVDDIAFNSGYRTYTATTGLPADYTPTLRGIIYTEMSSTGTGERLQTLIGVGGSNSWKTWQRNRTASWGAWKLIIDGEVYKPLVGEVKIWAVDSLPTGFLHCQGQSIDTTTYAALFGVLGYDYGGSGASFNLPDYRGEFLRGKDSGRGLDPDSSSRTDRGDGTTGNNVGTNQGDINLSHDHPSAGVHQHAAEGSHQHASAGDHNHQLNTFQSGASTAVTYPQIDSDDSETPEVLTEPTTTNGDHQHAAAGIHQHAGAGDHQHAASGGSEARPVNISVNYIIRF